MGRRPSPPSTPTAPPSPTPYRLLRYTLAQQALDAPYGPGARNYWKSHNAAALPDAAIDTLLAYAESLPTPDSDLVIHQVGGAINDRTPDATAYPHRESAFIVTIGARWREQARDEACIPWVRACHDALSGYALGGSYVNFISESAGRERDAYGPNYERLIDIKNTYDPSNLFRMNQNIQP